MTGILSVTQLKIMILFLDFDGVLHPQYEHEPVPTELAFCHLARFEAVMREFPSVKIVVSSTWREQFSMDVLRAKFSADIAARIIGRTPLAAEAMPPHMVEVREWEILAWLSANKRPSEEWIALDDSAWQFKRYRNRLLACTSYIGLDSGAEAKLKAALSKAGS